MVRIPSSFIVLFLACLVSLPASAAKDCPECKKKTISSEKTIKCDKKRAKITVSGEVIKEWPTWRTYTREENIDFCVETWEEDDVGNLICKMKPVSVKLQVGYNKLKLASGTRTVEGRVPVNCREEEPTEAKEEVEPTTIDNYQEQLEKARSRETMARNSANEAKNERDQKKDALESNADKKKFDEILDAFITADKKTSQSERVLTNVQKDLETLIERIRKEIGENHREDVAKVLMKELNIQPSGK